MATRKQMLEPQDVQARARTAYERNWRTWSRELFLAGSCAAELAVNLHAPVERDLATPADVANTREWVARWRTCTLPGHIEWQTRRWARVGDQDVPVRVSLANADEIAAWAGRSDTWAAAIARIADIDGHWSGIPNPPSREDAADAVQAGIASWIALPDIEWHMLLGVIDWLAAHTGERRFVRQLPIRGIDTKWMEQHRGALRPLLSLLSGGTEPFERPAKLFRCHALDSSAGLGGCLDFALPAAGLAAMETRPQRVVVCENLVNVLALDGMAGTLAIHGGGFAVTELSAVPWLSDTPLLYWGDLDTNGFAILNALRGFAPHATSAMMDEATLMHHFDLCVEEPKPATGPFTRLTEAERAALAMLQQGDPTRNIATLRLEQERIEWAWAQERITS